jgi:hypothetical protein
MQTEALLLIHLKTDRKFTGTTEKFVTFHVKYAIALDVVGISYEEEEMEIFKLPELSEKCTPVTSPMLAHV